jgi:hypothetical protein
MIVYFLGLLTVQSLLVLWFFSPLKTTLSEIFLGKMLMPHEFDDWLFIKNKWAGELLSCWVCCSFWCSLAVGLFLTIIADQVWYFPLITFFTYPSLCFLFKSFIKQ